MNESTLEAALIAVTALALCACSAPPTQDGPVVIIVDEDAGSDATSSDAGDLDAGAAGDAADAAPPPEPRTLTEVEVWAPENRFSDPNFTRMHSESSMNLWFSVVYDRSFQPALGRVLRKSLVDSPGGPLSGTLVMKKSAQTYRHEVDVYGALRFDTAPMEVTIWAGREAAQIEEEEGFWPVMALYGVSASSRRVGESYGLPEIAGMEPVRVGDYVWKAYGGIVPDMRGPAHLFLFDINAADLYISAPVAVPARPSAGGVYAPLERLEPTDAARRRAQDVARLVGAWP